MSNGDHEPQEDRAGRLSRRRKDRTQLRDATSSDNPDEADEVDNTVNTDNIDTADEPPEPVRLSQSTKGQMMHLPEDQHKRLHHLYTRMKADYEYEYDDDFEMNRHYFPLVLQYGLEQFEERDADVIRQGLIDFGDDSQ